MALKFTVHVVQSFIKGHRKSRVISIKNSRDNQNSPLTVEECSFSTCDCHRNLLNLTVEAQSVTNQSEILISSSALACVYVSTCAR